MAIDFSKPVLIVMDIDGTQLREDVPKSKYSPEDLRDIHALKSALNRITAKPGFIVMHATNRMRRFYEEDHGTLLAIPHYVSCDASTELLRVGKDGALVRDQEFQRRVKATGFDAAKAAADGLDFAHALTLTHADNQTDRKVSFAFDPATPLQERMDIHAALKSMQKPGTAVYMVETPETHIIDFVPAFCNKSAPVKTVAEQEGVPLSNVVVIGNSNNDIPMCLAEFNCAAVGNAFSSLKVHIHDLQEIAADHNRHFLANESNARGVVSALRHYNLYKGPGTV